MEAPLAYQHRAKPYAQEARFEMRPDHLAVTQGGRSGDFAYRDILMVRLIYKPRNTTNEGYQAKLYRRDRKTVALTNLSWKSLVDLERQDADYAAFVRALVGRIASANPSVVLEAGFPRWLHAVTTAAGLIAILALIFVGIQALRHGGWPMALMTVAIGLYFCWWTARYLARNRPRRFRADALPPDVMPLEPAPTR
jgi:hypothetical protein